MPKVCLLLRGLTVAQSFVCILIWVKLQVLDVLLKKKKGKIAAKLKSIWDGFWRWGSDFQKHRPSFPNRPSWPWSCPDCCEWNLADTDWPHFMCLLPSHLFCFLFFFFFIIPSSHFPESIFYLLFSILLIHTYTHAHTYTHMGQPPPSTTCWFSISKGHSQPSLSPGSRWRCLALSLELAPPGHCSPCRLVHGPSFSSTF